MATRYDQQTAIYIDTAYRLTIEKACAAIQPDDTVLEIGCGTGIVSLGVAPHAQRVIGYDVSERMIAMARNKAAESGLKQVTFQVGDGYHLPHEDGAFDVVLIPNVLHFVKDPAAQLAEAQRLLKPGGVLITVTDCYGEPAPGLLRLKLALQTLLHRIGIIPYLHNYRREDLRAMLVPTHWAFVEDGDLYANPVNYYVKARKR